LDKILKEVAILRLMKGSNKLILIILITSLLGNALGVYLYLQNRKYWAHQNYINAHPNGGNDSLVTYTINRFKLTEAQVDFFKMLPQDKSDYVFVGTSLTQGFPLQEAFNDLRLKNRGIGGNTTSDILSRIDDVIKGKPKKVFLEAGTNDINKYTTIDTPLKNIEAIAFKIVKSSPNTKLYIQSILPFGGKKEAAPIKELNKRVAAFCHENYIEFINLYPAYIKNGLLNKDYTIDGTHLNGKGYSIWTAKLKNYIKE
jgi:lysophospholipase L1-like esterase